MKDQKVDHQSSIKDMILKKILKIELDFFMVVMKDQKDKILLKFLNQE